MCGDLHGFSHLMIRGESFTTRIESNDTVPIGRYLNLNACECQDSVRHSTNKAIINILTVMGLTWVLHLVVRIKSFFSARIECYNAVSIINYMNLHGL